MSYYPEGAFEALENTERAATRYEKNVSAYQADWTIKLTNSVKTGLSVISPKGNAINELEDVAHEIAYRPEMLKAIQEAMAGHEAEAGKLLLIAIQNQILHDALVFAEVQAENE